MYIGVAASPRDRLAKQVMPSRIGHPWTLDHPPPATVCTGRNLLNTVLKDQRDGRPLIKCFGKIDTRNSDAIEALNAGFRSNRRLGRPVGGVSNRPAGTGFVSGRSLHLRSGLRERGPAVTGRPLFEAAIVRAQLDVIWTAGRSGGPFKLGRWKRKEDQGAANRDGVTRESPKTNRTGAGVTDAIRPRTRPGVRRTTGGAAGRRGERPRARQRPVWRVGGRQMAGKRVLEGLASRIRRNRATRRKTTAIDGPYRENTVLNHRVGATVATTRGCGPTSA